MFGFSSILDYFGLGEITGIDLFFAGMAVVGTLLFRKSVLLGERLNIRVALAIFKYDLKQ